MTVEESDQLYLKLHFPHCLIYVRILLPSTTECSFFLFSFLLCICMCTDACVGGCGVFLNVIHIFWDMVFPLLAHQLG